MAFSFDSRAKQISTLQDIHTDRSTVGLVARSGHSLRAADAAWWTRAIHSRCKAHATRPRAHRHGLSATHTCHALSGGRCNHIACSGPHGHRREAFRASECVHARWTTRDAARTPWDWSLGARQRRRERLFEVRDTHSRELRLVGSRCEAVAMRRRLGAKLVQFRQNLS